MPFRSENYDVSISSRFNSSRTRPTVYVLGTDDGPSLIRADVLSQSWLDNIGQTDKPEIRSATDRILVAFGNTTHHLCIGESRYQATFGMVDKLALPVLLQTTFIDKFTKTIHPAEREIVPHQSPPVPILVVHKTKREA